jgi:hypothetical protein
LTTSEAGKQRNPSMLLRKSRDRADIASITIELIGGNRYHRRALVGGLSRNYRMFPKPDASPDQPSTMTGYSHDGLFGRGKT